MVCRPAMWIMAGVLVVLTACADAGSERPANEEPATTVDGTNSRNESTRGDVPSMPTNTALSREWVEIREESEEGRIVLRPLGPDIPPARGGRRRLDLREPGDASAREPGAADAMEARDGSWTSPEEGVLDIAVPGWTGTYTVIELHEDKLVIEPR